MDRLTARIHYVELERILGFERRHALFFEFLADGGLIEMGYPHGDVIELSIWFEIGIPAGWRLTFKLTVFVFSSGRTGASLCR